MDMNFPHKYPKWAPLDATDAIAFAVPDHRALLALAIARQSSSESARNYVAAKQGLSGTNAAVRQSFMKNRMAFFAGQSLAEGTPHQKAKLFVSGCFRPDLAHGEINEMHG